MAVTSSNAPLPRLRNSRWRARPATAVSMSDPPSTSSSVLPAVVVVVEEQAAAAHDFVEMPRRARAADVGEVEALRPPRRSRTGGTAAGAPGAAPRCAAIASAPAPTTRADRRASHRGDRSSRGSGAPQRVLAGLGVERALAPAVLGLPGGGVGLGEMAVHVGRRARAGAGPQMGQRVRGLAGAQQRQPELELRGCGSPGSASSALRSKATARSWSPAAALTVASRRSAASSSRFDCSAVASACSRCTPRSSRVALVGRGRAAAATWPGRSALPCARDRRSTARRAAAAAASNRPCRSRTCARPDVRVGPARVDHQRRGELRQRFGEPADAEVHLGQLVVRGRRRSAPARSAARTRRWRRRSPAAIGAARRASGRRC